MNRDDPFEQDFLLLSKWKSIDFAFKKKDKLK